MADKEIFMTNGDKEDKGGMGRQLFSNGSPASQSTASQQSTAQSQVDSKQAQQLSTEQEVILMNIDYFEQWDRVHQKFQVQEKEVLASMKANGVRML